MTDELRKFAWPAERLGEALALLARHSGLALTPEDAPVPPPHVLGNRSQIGSWIEASGRRLGLEAEPVETPYAEAEQMLSRAGPALLRLPEGSGLGYLLLLRGTPRDVCVLTPDRVVVRLALEEVRAALCRQAEAPLVEQVERMLEQAGVAAKHRPRARPALLRQLLTAARLGGCWLVRPMGTADLASQAREARLPRLLLALLGAHTCEYVLWILSWWLLGWMAMQGRFEKGWLLAWFLLLLTAIPFRLLSTAAGGLLSIRAGAVLKRRLLAGALKLDPDEVRHLGVGQLLGRVLESGEIELTALTGGFLGLTALVELALAGFVLGAGAGSGLHVVLLLATGVVAFVLAARYYRGRRRWTADRLNLTNDLVERMVGHRTRLAQEAREHWNAGEDQALEHYVGTSQRLDRQAVRLQVLVPRGWFLAAVLGLVPAFVAGGRSGVSLAIGVGGILLAYRALRNLVDGLERLTAAAIAWERIAPFWQAAGRHEPPGHPRFAVPDRPTDDGRAELAPGHERNGKPLLEGHDLLFRYPQRNETVLQGVTVRIGRDDRLLLEGPSGGGKSTLAAVLAGGRVPQAGLLLLDGLDRETLGAAGWRQRVVIAPQFHENHVLMGTFAFNLLMGRGWPPQPADLEEAERLCRALDLGPLLDRMPAGLQQTVGETGWQLSHGEKSRLYLARALLQRADLVILDESFAALDPQTLRHALGYVVERASTLLVIAHP